MEYRKQKKMYRWGFLFHRFQITTENGSVAGFKEHILNFCMGVCVTLMYWL